MRARTLGVVVVMSVCMVAPLMGSDFTVAAATGVLEPEGLQVGLELANGTLLRLESWGRIVLREVAGCRHTLILAGAPEFQLRPSEDCAATVEPSMVIGLLQEGSVFGAYLAASSATDDLIQTIAQEPCVFLPRFSEEGNNRRRCPSGYALRALRCTGPYCDNKDLLCCPYLAGEPDPSPKELVSRVISEELPNFVARTGKGFLAGFACYGPYCDEVEVFQFRPSGLSNTQECDWTGWTSERPGEWLDCGADRLMSGIRCRSDYCGEIAALCCGTEAK